MLAKEFVLPPELHFDAARSGNMTAAGHTQMIQFDPDGSPTASTGIQYVHILDQNSGSSTLTLSTMGGATKSRRGMPMARPQTNGAEMAGLRLGSAFDGKRDACATTKGGFTLIEVLAALVFLAILVPVIAEALTLSSRVSTLSDRREVAAELAENQLSMELAGGNWQAATATNGDFGTNYPGYTWKLTQAGWSGDSVNSMTELTMEVDFQVQGKAQSVKLTTLVNASLATAQGAALSGTANQSTSATTMPSTGGTR